jgi:Tol biopolymer transport system component
MTMRRAVVGLLLVGGAVAGLLVAPVKPARATFAGANGWIAFASDRDGDREIYVTRSDGSAVVRITSNTFDDFDPNISPDGTRIVFLSNRSGSVEVWMMRINGAQPTKLTSNTLVESHPVWDPMSGQIAFAGSDGVDSEIYKMTSRGQNVRNLTNNPEAFDSHPAWSPGGIRIAFDSANRGGDPGTNIFTVNKDGTGILKLTSTGEDSHPNYAPDNKNLTFVSGRDYVPPGASHFADVFQPVGIAFSPAAGMLVTQLTRDQVLSVDDSGETSVFATLPETGNANLERYIAVSPGLGGFPQDYVYVTVRQDILRIAPDGSTVEVWVTIPGLANSNNSINFDTVGTFGNDLLVASGPKADLWRVGSDGTVAQVVNLPATEAGELEDPEVAPLDYAPYGGQVIVTSKLDNKVFAIQTDGSHTTVGEWPGADDVAFIPPTLCDYGTSGGAFFMAMRDEDRILRMPDEDFAGATGALVPDEISTNIALFHSDGATIDISLFSPPVGTPELEGIAFAGCTLSNRPATGTGWAPEVDVVPGEIYKMTSTGANQVRLTNNAFDETSPAWSPDGNQIVFPSARDDDAGCEDTGSCRYELYTMSAVDGSGQVNITNNPAADDASPDWQAVSFTPIQVSDNVFAPALAKPKQGGSVLWDFFGPSAHTATDDSGLRLFDSRAKLPGGYFVFVFGAAGNYPYLCTIHPTLMAGTVRVPIKAAPISGNELTQFTITWAAFVPSGYQVDVQIKRPTDVDFVDWMINVTGKGATFTPDAGPGQYSFRARLERFSNLETSDYSTPVTITVNP